MTEGPTTATRVAEQARDPLVPPPAPRLPDGRPNGLLAANPGLTAADLAVQHAATRAKEGLQ